MFPRGGGIGQDVEVIELAGVPLVLFRAWELHSDNMLREYMLATGPGYPYSATDVSRAKQARDMIAGAISVAARHAARDARTVDVTVTLSGGVSEGDYSTLQAVLEHGNQLAQAGEFLTLPPLPEIVAFRNWLCTQVIDQAAGQPPARWSADRVAEVSDAPPAQWPDVRDLPADCSWLVGDDQNRILAASQPALDLLGWTEEALVGQRILAVIPPELRDAHVGAFARATLTGTYRLLGQHLAVHAWTCAGVAVPVTLTLEKHPAARGRTVFVAWLEHRPA